MFLLDPMVWLAVVSALPWLAVHYSPELRVAVRSITSLERTSPVMSGIGRNRRAGCLAQKLLLTPTCLCCKLVGMKSNLRDYMDRPKRYDNIDGTGEMFMGMMLLAFALAGYLEAGLPEDSSRWLHGLVTFGVLIPVLAFGYWSRRVIKEHFTWPRTGYAAYPRRGGRSWWTGVAAAGLLGGITAAGLACLAAFTKRHAVMSIPQMAIWASYIAVYALWVYFMGKKDPWKWLMVVFMVLGLLAIALNIPTNSILPSKPALLFIGLVWLGSGAGTLYTYLRHTKVSAPETE